MNKIMHLRFAFLFFLLIIPLNAFAGDFDGSKPLFGSVVKLIEINQFKVNDDVDPDTVSLPQKFSINFEEKLVRPSKDSLIRRTSKIERVVHIENKLILQGVEEGLENVEDGLAWSLTISKKTGKFVLSASGDRNVSKNGTKNRRLLRINVVSQNE